MPFQKTGLVRRIGVYCNGDQFSLLESLASGIPDLSKLSVILAGQASLVDSLPSLPLRVRRAVDIAGTPVPFPEGVKFLEAKWVFVNQTTSAIIFYDPQPHTPEGFSYLLSYTRRLIDGGDGSLLVVTSQPDQLRGQLVAACDELELSRLSHLFDARSLCIVRKIESDSLRFVCGIH
jgi:hypothetical protein